MTDRTSAPASHEHTTLGAIVKRTGGVVQTGPFGSQLHASDYVQTGTPLVMPINLGDNVIIESGIARIGPQDARRLRRHALRENDIVFSRRGDVGRRSIVRREQAGWICGTGCFAARFGPKLDRVDPSFVALYLGSLPAQAWLQNNAVGGTMPNLNTRILASTPVALPPKSYQEEVVEILDDAAYLVAMLERLIAKKQAIKRGVMQQLLTGKARLPGFGGDWSMHTLGELGTFLKGRGIKRDDVRQSGVPCIRYGELYTTYRDYTSETVSFVSREIAATALPIRTGDILFAGSGETREEIGTCVAYNGAGPAVAGGDIIVLRGTAFNAAYLACLLNTPLITSQKARLGQGDAVVHISSRALSAVEVSLPPRPEQDAIAAVLTDLDDDLAVMRARLAKVKNVKQGMMQELLTGRTRLVVSEAVA
jgi:type I restriction enzyme, S subunit